MNPLPDLEGLAIFARVAQAGSFARAADDLGLSNPTVSKAVSRLERRLGVRLFHRTSRRLSLTDTGQTLLEAASRMLAEAEAAECEASDNAATPRGLVRIAAPMSFGLGFVAPLLPDLLRRYPELSLDISLSDAVVDLIGGGFDLALRIADLPDSSLMARRLAPVKRLCVASPDYLARRGRPTHPAQLAEHDCLIYANLPTPQTWRFVGAGGEEVSVRVGGPLRANNGDALTAAALAGCGVAAHPDFIVWREVAEGRLEPILTDWTAPPIALHLVAPPGVRPARVTAVMDFFAAQFSDPPWTRDQLQSLASLKSSRSERSGEPGSPSETE
jgi:DNA-binding transcriptional LysR family regulator